MSFQTILSEHIFFMLCDIFLKYKFINNDFNFEKDFEWVIALLSKYKIKRITEIVMRRIHKLFENSLHTFYNHKPFSMRFNQRATELIERENIENEILKLYGVYTHH